MPKSKFEYLFDKEPKDDQNLPNKNAKFALFVVFLLFFILYLNYKPYLSHARIPGSLTERIFSLYFFIINQTLGIVHEAGHGICYVLPCPKLITAANGTVFQWLFPLGIGYYYRKRGNLMAFYVGLFILGISMDYTAWYMSTAHEGLIVPASKSFLGVDGYHDFNYIFDTLGVLPYDYIISGLTRIAAYLLMLGSLLAMFFRAMSPPQISK